MGRTVSTGAPREAKALDTPSSGFRRHARTARGDQPILSVRGAVPETDAGAFIAEALHDIRAYMQEHHISSAGPPFSICRPRGSSVDVEAAWPTAGAVAGTSRIHAGSIPRSLMAGHRAHVPDPADSMPAQPRSLERSVDIAL